MPQPDTITASAAKGGVAAPALPGRDPRIDAFRGLALITIFIDHVPGNPYEFYTLRNWGFSDAAEAFFLMSGIAAGLAYSGGIGRKGLAEGGLPVWKRAWTLYLVHLFLTFWAIAIYAAGSHWLQNPDLLTKINLRMVFSDPEDTLPALPMLLHQLGYVNILPVYSVLLVTTPMVIWAALKRPGLVMAGSVLLWFVAGLWRLNFPNYPNPGGWFFNPFSWQLIFTIGLLTGVSLKQGNRFVPKLGWLFWLAAGWLALVLVWRYVPVVGGTLNHQMARLGSFGIPFHFVSHDKTFVALPRLLHALALAYVLSCLPIVRRAAGSGPAGFLRLLGRHGLLVFASGTLASLVMQVLVFSLVNPAPAAWAVLPVGMVVMLGVAALAERRRLARLATAKAGPAVDSMSRMMTPDLPPVRASAK